MANAFNGSTFTNIAQIGFSAFTKRLVSLNIFSTDFSTQAAEQGDTVTTRIMPVSAAAQDLQSDHSGSRFAAAADTTTTAVSVTLNQQPITGFHVTDEEAGKIGSGVMSDMLTRKIEQEGYAIANSVLNYTYNLLTAANFANTEKVVGAASAFDLDDVIDLRTDLAGLGFPVDQNRAVSLVLASAYKGALKKDGAVQDLSASGISVVQDGILEQVDSFALYESSTLPPAGGTPATENLVGFAATPDAISLCMRPVVSQAPGELLHQEVLQDPTTGVVMVYRAAYDADLGKVNHTFETLYGASPAQSEALQRLVSA